MVGQGLMLPAMSRGGVNGADTLRGWEREPVYICILLGSIIRSSRFKKM